ncbi:MAG TPA: hypothetical protein VEC35_09465 [Noviherbaspirillum sp.]|nr:hypothetical protein [Noviherbaspirillum sp.]
MAMLIVTVFFISAVILMKIVREKDLAALYKSEANALLTVQRAATAYAAANKSNFQSGQTVMNVSNQYAPTVNELNNLGFLTNTGTNITSPFGSTWRITLTLLPSGAITGLVYLNGNIRHPITGAADQPHACGIAVALGDIGLCTPPNNSALLGNGSTTPIANPSGQPATVAASIFVPA